jgi:hypothetical protein
LEEYHRYATEALNRQGASSPKPSLKSESGPPKLILVGTKSDKYPYQREVSAEEGLRQAQEWGCQFYETSAKTGDNVQLAFEDMVRIFRESAQSQKELRRAEMETETGTGTSTDPIATRVDKSRMKLMKLRSVRDRNGCIIV